MNKILRSATLPGLLAVAMLTACAGESAEQLLGSAKSYLAKNDVKAAIIQLKSSLQKAPDSGEARFLLGKALLDSGDAVSAEVEFRKALDYKHPPGLVLPELARALLIQGQVKRLTDEYAQTSLPEAAADADLKTSVAIAYGMQGNRAEAERVLAAALKQAPEFPAALLFHSRLKADAGDVDGAIALIDRVLGTDPANHEAWHLKGELLAAVKRDNVAAIGAFRKALAAKDNFVPSHVRLVSLLLAGGDVPGAKTQLDAIRKLLPNHPQTLYVEALVAVAERDFKLAREKVQLLLRVAADNVNVLQLAGTIEMNLNSALQAETYLNKVLAAVPGQVATRRQLALIALRTGRPARALELLQPLLDKPSADATDFGLAAEAHLLAGDAKKAQDYFARAAKLNPKDVKSRTALALSRMQSGDPSEALGDLRDIAATDTGTMADLALISAQVGRKDFAAALKALDAMEKKQPDRPLASLLRGRVHLLRKDVAAARAGFERALQIDGKFYPAAAGLATIDLSEGKPDAARKRFDDLLKTDPKNVQALLAIASLRASAGAGKDEMAKLISDAINANPTELAPRLTLINYHLSNKDYKLALAAAQVGLAALPDNPEMVDALGRSQALTGDTNQALASFNKLASLQPQSPLAHMRLAEVHLSTKNPDAATRSLNAALAITPNLLDAQRGLIQIDLAEKRPEAALRTARNVQKQRPGEVVGYALEGDIEASRKNWSAAEAAYGNALKQKGPDRTLVAIRLHSTLLAANKTAEADRFISGWAKDHPDDGMAVMYLGDRALQQNDLPLAETRYRTLLKMQPENALAMNNLAWVLIVQKKPGALPLAQKAVDLLPNAAAVLDTLALALAEDNQLPKAVEVMRKAVTLAPEATGLQLNLARLYVRAGDKAAARTELEALAKLGDKFADQPKVAEMLKTL